MESTPQPDPPDSDDETSGMPDGEPELPPMGLHPDADTDAEPEDEQDLPGFPDPEEPEISG